MSTGGGEDRQSVLDPFGDAVNMSAAESERWLGTETAREAGQKGGGGGESTGSGQACRGVAVRRRADVPA
ncbi:DUF3140 domain-containing protein [Streptomyces sp. NPDC060184]|uniref:DUF3140 domain-containing protein n=1 Tax=Streptomyces sp. NPDC060184 TaxID=3347064 RepID=UPI00364747EF